FSTSWPQIEARPPVGFRSVVRMRTIVVFPAPLWPSRPSTVPAGISKSTPSSAVRSPNRRLTFSARTAQIIAPTQPLSPHKVNSVESLRERKKAATRVAIADAAAQLFAEFGYDNVSVERVAREAGVSKQTVFNYFPSKELLVFDRADEVRTIMVAALRDRGP